MRKQRKSNRATLKRKADKLFSLKVRSRGYCQLKGLDHIACSQDLQCMHVITRSNHRLRWEDLNALAGCFGHHRWYTTHPFEFILMIQKHFPLHYDFVMKYRNEIWNKDYDEVFRRLEL